MCSSRRRLPRSSCCPFWALPPRTALPRSRPPCEFHPVPLPTMPRFRPHSPARAATARHRWPVGHPADAKSLALIVDDPDAPDPPAPSMTWVHWVLYNLPPPPGLPEARAAALPPGTREGLNDWKRTGYGGPCPPDRTAPLLLQALRARHRAPRPEQAHQGRAGEGHARPHPGRRRMVGTYQKK